MTMRQFLRRWRYPLLAGFALLAVFAGLPDPRSTDSGPAARRSEVVSAFFNLTVEPGSGGLAGVRLDWLVRNEWKRDRRRERLEHVHPDLLAAHARRRDMSPAAFRELLIDPTRPDPFDIAGAALEFPEAEGQRAGDWAWIRVVETAPACGQWLLFWNADAWYFAPVGASDLNDAFQAALPGLAHALPAALPDCAP